MQKSDSWSINPIRNVFSFVLLSEISGLNSFLLNLNSLCIAYFRSSVQISSNIAEIRGLF